MKIWLLTHSEELKKASGTGKLVKQALGNSCEIITWSRVEASPSILSLPTENTLLIYLSDHTDNKYNSNELEEIENIIIIDGTWQQARKIYNRSPYLKTFYHHEIQGAQSTYTKRRNQKNIGLCTAEVALHLLKQNQHPAYHTLEQLYQEFNQ